MKESTHHNLTIYTESAWKRIPVLIMLWAYFLYYSVGRVTYIRKYPNISTNADFSTMNRTYYGCVRFTATSKLGFKWIKFSIDDGYIMGFGKAYPTPFNAVNTKSDKV